MVIQLDINSVLGRHFPPALSVLKQIKTLNLCGSVAGMASLAQRYLFTNNQEDNWEYRILKHNLVELTAYELYFVQHNTYSFDLSAAPVSGSSWSNIILKEMNVMMGTETSCYTSLT